MEDLILDYIQRGYSNKYINLLLDVEVDWIEVLREQLKQEREAFHLF